MISVFIEAALELQMSTAKFPRANELQRDLVAKIRQEQSQSRHGKVYFLSVYGATAIIVKELKKIATLSFLSAGKPSL
jgi:hypothetical protein